MAKDETVTEPRTEITTENPMLAQALAAMQRTLIQERMYRTAAELEVERLTEVCSAQARELMRLSTG
jgi:hypothetical protein